MIASWQPLIDLTVRSRRLLLTTHVRPDGDALGSVLALAHVLRQQGKHVRAVISSSYPARYDFLDPAKEVIVFQPPGDELRDCDAVIVLDTGTWNQLDKMADFVRGLPVPRLVIDHHVTQDDLGGERLVDTTAEACGRLVYEAIRALGGTITAEVAEALFTALAMDTGWFYHRNTSGRTFALAEELTRCGARPDRLHQLLFERNPLSRLKLTGRLLDHLTISHGGKLAQSVIRKADYEATASHPLESEDLVNYLMSVAGVEVGLLFLEQLRGGMKVSFRSRTALSAAKVAEQFGGGGHPAAAGAIVQGTLEEVQARVVQAVEAAMGAAAG